MKPTIEILENIRKNSNNNYEEVFTRLFRYMLRPDIYYVAYNNLYSNNGAATNGVDNDTADGFSEEKVQNIIKSLANDTYLPKPSRRTYIQKNNGKMRPLGIPTFTDKLVQEVLRLVLEAVYEPIFLDCSHGFRPNKSCHTALKDLKHQFHGTRWFIEGDIKGCFDNIDHSVLVKFIGDKIKDARLIKLIYRFLKAGYLEKWQYNNTYSGTPQGGIVSPLLANIYLHELDKFVLKLKSEFDKPAERCCTPEYDKARYVVSKLRSHIKKCDNEVEKADLLKELKISRAKLVKTPAKSQTDKVLKYIRYADDFIIGVNGNKEDCISIKAKLSDFIRAELKMELSEEKTLITHSTEKARFLGYDVRVRRNDTIKPKGTRKITQRTLNNMTELSVPIADKLNKFLFNNHIVEQQADGTLKPCKRKSLLRLTDFEIVSTYNAELRGICNYYNMASNFCDLHYFAYLMEYSCLKTLAGKHKSKKSKIKEMYKDGKGGWCIAYETKKERKFLYFANFRDSKKVKNVGDRIQNASFINRYNKTTFEGRLKAKICELCGSENSKYYEIHHVNKVKNLSGKAKWEQVMIAKNRKTIVVCRDCHKEIHK